MNRSDIPRLFMDCTVSLSSSRTEVVKAFYDDGSDLNLISPAFVHKCQLRATTIPPVLTASATGKKEYEVTKEVTLHLKYPGETQVQ